MDDYERPELEKYEKYIPTPKEKRPNESQVISHSLTNLTLIEKQEYSQKQVHTILTNCFDRMMLTW